MIELEYIEERYAIANKIKSSILEDAQITGALFIGSVANDEADQYSDLDYYVYVTTPLWTKQQLAVWLKNFGLVTSLHYWTGLEKHHLMIDHTRVDFSIRQRSQQDELSSWPHIFFVETAVIKDVDDVLRNSIRTVRPKEVFDDLNSLSAYVQNVFVIAIQLIRGETINARSRFTGVLESKARLLQEIPLGTALWREPTRHIEANLTRKALKELHHIAYLSDETKFIEWVVDELNNIGKSDGLPAGIKEVAVDYRNTLIRKPR